MRTSVANGAATVRRDRRCSTTPRRSVLRRLSIAAAGAVLMASAHPAKADFSVTLYSWNYEGGDWFNSSSWSFAELFSGPDSNLPVYIGPSQWFINGLPSDIYSVPNSAATLSADFTSPRLTLATSNVQAALTINNGAVYTVEQNVNLGLLPNFVDPLLLYQDTDLIFETDPLTNFNPNGPQFAASLTITQGATLDTPLLMLGSEASAVLHLDNGTITGTVWASNVAGVHTIVNLSGACSIGSLSLAMSSGSSTALNIASGTTLSVGSLTFGVGTTINNNSTLTANSNWSGTISQFTNGASGVLQLNGGVNVTMAGPIVNQGVIQIGGDSTVGTTTLSISSSVTLSGGGQLVLSSSDYARLGTGSGETLVNVDNTIRGQGVIWSNIINDGTIRAEGGTLYLGGSVDNVGATVEAGPGSTLNATSLFGGTLATDASAKVFGLLDSVTSTQTLSVHAQNSLSLKNSLVNQGTVQILGDATVGTTGLYLSGDVTLSGGGQLVMTSDYSRVGSGSGETLVNVDNTIRGQGAIYSNIINHDTIRADGGSLYLASGVDNDGATVEVTAGSTLTATSLTGGTLVTDTSAKVFGLLDSVTSTQTLSVHADNALSLKNSLINQGTVQILGNSTVGTAGLYLSGNVTLSGGGQLVMTSDYSRLGSGSGETLINLDNTISGQGVIWSKISNGGLIRSTGGQLSLTAQVSGGGDVIVSAGSELTVSADLTASSLTVEPTGVFTFWGPRLEVTDFTGDFSHTTGTYAPGASPALSSLDGDYLQSGGLLEIEVAGTAPGQFDLLAISGDVTLSGGGLSLVLLEGFAFPEGQALEILDVGGNLTGTFNGLTEGAQLPDTAIFITYAGGDGNDIVLYSVPEPGVTTALLGAATALLQRKRRHVLTAGSC